MGQVRFTDLDGVVLAGRLSRADVAPAVVDVSDKDSLAQDMREILSRLSRLERDSRGEVHEYEVNVGNMGAMTTIQHGIGAPVRWYVTDWAGASVVAVHELVRDASSDADNLVLRSYSTGKAVIRIEQAQRASR